MAEAWKTQHRLEQIREMIRRAEGEEVLAMTESRYETLSTLLEAIDALPHSDVYFLLQEVTERNRQRSLPPWMPDSSDFITMIFDGLTPNPSLAICLQDPRKQDPEYIARQPDEEELYPNFQAYYLSAVHRYGAWMEHGSCSKCEVLLVGAVRSGRCPFCDAPADLT